MYSIRVSFRMHSSLTPRCHHLYQRPIFQNASKAFGSRAVLSPEYITDFNGWAPEKGGEAEKWRNGGWTPQFSKRGCAHGLLLYCEVRCALAGRRSVTQHSAVATTPT